MRRHFSFAAGLMALAAVYFLAGKFGLSLAIIHPSASAVWPPTGIALTAVLLWGRRVWPALFVGAFFANLTTAGSVLTSLGIAAGNTSEAVAGAWLVTRFAGGAGAFEQSATIFRFVFLAGVVSTLSSATIGVTCQCLGHYARWSDYGPIWLTWWMGDMVSDIIVAPLLLIWTAKLRPQLKLARVPEALLLAFVVMIIAEVVFGGWVMPRGTIYAIEYLALLPLLWAAWRFGLRGASLAAVAISTVAIAATVGGFGPFATSNENESLLLLQAFMATITLTALVLASVISQRNRAFDALEAARKQLSNHAAQLEEQVGERTRELQQTVRSMEGFCYSIAHDLRAPLRYITGFSSVLMGDYAPALDEKGRDYLRRIRESAERMDKLIWDLLEFGRLSSADLKLASVNADSIMRAAAERLREEYPAAVVEIDAALPAVVANPSALEQVAANLLQNAAKFVGSGVTPKIHVEAQRTVGRVRILVKDNGIGISPEYHEKIFGVFQRLHPDRAYPGTGMGLAIVKTAIERMGGCVGLEAAPSEGSCFWFELRAA